MSDERLNLGDSLEKQIVAMALADRGFFIHCHGILKPVHFQDEQQARTWKFLQVYFNKYNTLPPEPVILQALKQSMSSLNEEQTIQGLRHFDASAKEWLRDEVLRIVKHQRMKAFVLKAAGEVSKTNPNYDILLEKAKEIILLNPEVNLGTDYYAVKERYAKIIGQNEDRISTGYPTLDKYLGGGFSAKELYLWMGPPGLGKSLWLTNLGKNLLQQGKNIIHYTMEMSEERTSMRYDAAILNTPTKDLIHHWQEVVNKIDVYHKHLKNHLVIKEFPTRSANANHLRAHMQKILEYQGFVPDVLIIDYGDIMKSINTYEKEYESQGAIFEEIRAIAQEYNIPIITASQTNRDSLEKEIITMKNIADSFTKARIADFIAAICQQPEEKEMGVQKLFLAKNRNNQDGVLIGFHVDYARMQITDKGELS